MMGKSEESRLSPNDLIGVLWFAQAILFWHIYFILLITHI